jgi:hypothetical protein
VNPEIAEQILRDYQALRRPDTDPELEAVRTAILLEDVFGVTLPDAEIGPSVLAGPSAVTALVARLLGAPLMCGIRGAAQPRQSGPDIHAPDE